MIRRLTARLSPHWRVVRGFQLAGWRDAASYPLAQVTLVLGTVLPLVVFGLVGRMIPSVDGFRGDYLTFVASGLIVNSLVDAAARGLGGAIDQELQTGRIEMLFAEPIATLLMPLGLVQFQLVARLLAAGASLAVAVLLGAEFAWTWRWLPAIGVVVMGVAAVLSIAMLGVVVKILAKRSDPILALFSQGALVFSGALVPIETLPDWAEPISLLFPQTYVVSLFRHFVLPQGSVEASISPAVAFTVMGVMVAVMLPLSSLLLSRAVDFGRRRGLLGTY